VQAKGVFLLWKKVQCNRKNRHWKKGGSRTTNPAGWSKVLSIIVAPTAFLEPSTNIRMCAIALRSSGTAQGVLPSDDKNVVAKI
jgi:hypothetical protein